MLIRHSIREDNKIDFTERTFRIPKILADHYKKAFSK